MFCVPAIGKSKGAVTQGAVVGEVPINTVTPSITSNADIAAPNVGDVLTVTTPGIYTGIPVPTLSYQWKHGSNDSNATGTGAATASYTVDATDELDTLYCAETATNASGSDSADSNDSGTVVELPDAPVNTVPPVANGGDIGGNSDVTNGTWNNDPTSYTYSWEGSNTAGALWAPTGQTSSSIIVGAGVSDGDLLRCVVTAINAGGGTPEPSNNLVVSNPI